MFAGRHNHFADCHKSQAVTPGSDPSVYFRWHEEKDDEGTIDLCREPPALFSMTLFTCSREHILFRTLNLPCFAIFLQAYWFILSDHAQTGAFVIDQTCCVQELFAAFFFRACKETCKNKQTNKKYFQVNKLKFCTVIYKQSNDSLIPKWWD